VTISFNTDVNFDLKGFTISGDGTGAGILVFPPEALHGVYIHGGTVMGFGTGIGIVGTSLSFRHPGLIVFHVNDMTITGNGAGIVLFETGFGHFSGNTISGNVLGVSISLSGENQFNGNTISGNQGMGVRFFSAFFGNQFNSNSVTDNGGGGFDLQPPAFGGCFENLISSNDISRNGGFGVRLFHHNCATVLGNTVNGNPVGIQILGGLGSSFNTIQSNTALGNTTFDLQDDSPDCGTNTWRSNIFGTANQGCIQ
jgi:parallel beta-helix repeat protein